MFYEKASSIEVWLTEAYSKRIVNNFIAIKTIFQPEIYCPLVAFKLRKVIF